MPTAPASSTWRSSTTGSDGIPCSGTSVPLLSNVNTSRSERPNLSVYGTGASPERHAPRLGGHHPTHGRMRVSPTPACHPVATAGHPPTALPWLCGPAKPLHRDRAIRQAVSTPVVRRDRAACTRVQVVCPCRALVHGQVLRSPALRQPASAGSSGWALASPGQCPITLVVMPRSSSTRILAVIRATEL